jgi:hypothetical protein
VQVGVVQLAEHEFAGVARADHQGADAGALAVSPSLPADPLSAEEADAAEEHGGHEEVEQVDGAGIAVADDQQDHRHEDQRGEADRLEDADEIADRHVAPQPAIESEGHREHAFGREGDGKADRQHAQVARRDGPEIEKQHEGQHQGDGGEGHVQDQG